MNDSILEDGLVSNCSSVFIKTKQRKYSRGTVAGGPFSKSSTQTKAAHYHGPCHHSL